MKISKPFSVLALAVMLTSCCTTGTLVVKNTSADTNQELIIDGESYGVITPGETMEVELIAGSHTWKLLGIDGGAGCGETTTLIQGCMEHSYTCNGK